VEDPVELAAMGAVEGVGVALGAVVSVGKHGGFIGWDGCEFRFFVAQKKARGEWGFCRVFCEKRCELCGAFVVKLWWIAW
jgi:hypothetical protein